MRGGGERESFLGLLLSVLGCGNEKEVCVLLADSEMMDPEERDDCNAMNCEEE